MPTLKQVRDKADNWLTLRWSMVRDRQIAYAANHDGKYWQGLRTHTFELEYTDSVDAGAPADNLADSPSDVAESWLDRYPELASVNIPAVFIMDVYDGPSGKGFVLTVGAKWNGNKYARSQNYGPETWRTVGWHQVVDDGIEALSFDAQAVQPIEEDGPLYWRGIKIMEPRTRRILDRLTSWLR